MGCCVFFGEEPRELIRMITLGTAMMRIIFSSHNAEQNAATKMAKTYSFVVQETGSVSVFNEVLLIAAKIAHGEAGSSALVRSRSFFF